MVNKDTSELDSPTVAESKFCSFVVLLLQLFVRRNYIMLSKVRSFLNWETSWSVIQTVLFSSEEDSNASGCKPS